MPARKCDRCDRPASVQYTDMTGKKAKVIYLCRECAGEERNEAVTLGIDLHKVVHALLSAHVSRRVGELAQARCPSCGITFAEIQSGSRLGCPRDYEVFGEALGVVLEKIQHGESHTGKRPRRRAAHSDQLLELRGDLRRSVLEQDYERAARLRDEIRRLENSQWTSAI